MAVIFRSRVIRFVSKNNYIVTEIFGEQVRVAGGYIMFKRQSDSDDSTYTQYVDSRGLITRPSNVSRAIIFFQRWRFDGSGDESANIYSDKEFVEGYIVPSIEDGSLPQELNPFEQSGDYLILNRDVNCRFKKDFSLLKSDTGNIAMIMMAVGRKAGLVRD